MKSGSVAVVLCFKACTYSCACWPHFPQRTRPGRARIPALADLTFRSAFAQGVHVFLRLLTSLSAAHSPSSAFLVAPTEAVCSARTHGSAISVNVRHKYVSFGDATEHRLFYCAFSVFTSDQLHLITNSHITSNIGVAIPDDYSYTRECMFHFILHEQLISG
jgi:hypothetical protein